MQQYSTSPPRSVMAGMSDEEKAAYKKAKLDDIRTFHGDLIKDLGISILDFNMKMPFYDDMGNLVVGIFPNEFKKNKGFYFEIIDKNLNPVDPERKVYRIPFNATFQEEYRMNERGSYLVPLDELRIIDPQSVAISKFSAVSNMSDKSSAPKPKQSLSEIAYKAPAVMEDMPFSEMTLRDFFAILNKRPVSSKQWLNDLIKDSKNYG